MKRQEWNEEQIEQLLKQFPSIKDKQTAEEIYQSIQYKQLKRKSKTWIAPMIATVAALFIFALISPFLFQNITSNEESAMDIAENSVRIEKNTANDNGMAEAKLAQESSIEQRTLDKKALISEEQETFVTSANEAEETITVGFTDGYAQNIIPISLETDEKRDQLEQIDEIIPETYVEELGPVNFELSRTEFFKKGNSEEIYIDYKGDPNLSSSVNDVFYREAIQETFRWKGYKTAKLLTNGDEGIVFGNTGELTDLEIKQQRNKAYFLYQYDEQTLKLLVPSPNPYDSIDIAFEEMKKGFPNQNLKPTIMNNITTIRTKENGELLEVQFNKGIGFKDSEPTIIMLESILLTAKEFGYRTVQFKGMNIEKIGVMDVTKPIDVPFSPNPIEAN